MNKILRFIGCTIGLLIFGVIYGEILNALSFFAFKVNVYLFAFSIAFTFSLMDIIFNHFEEKASISNKDYGRFEKIKTYYYIFFSFLGFILLVAVPFVWWGAIKRLAIMANEGIK